MNNTLKIFNNNNTINYTRHFPPANQEWYNSIYVYNKNSLRYLPIADKMILKLIKSYFNFYSLEHENKINFNRLRIRLRRLSVNRIFVSRAELKHTASKVIITLYVYNRQKKYFYNKLNFVNINEQLTNTNLIEKIKLEGLRVIEEVRKEKELIANVVGLIVPDIFKIYEQQQYEDFIRKSLEKEMLSIFYKNILFFNKSKFDNTYLLRLNNLLSKIYYKKIEFNLVNLEYLHLNSDILSESIIIKLRNRKNRLLKVLKTSLNMVKLPYLNKLNLKLNLKNLVLNKTNSINENNIIENILNNIKHKSICGVRLEATGRLSRRLTAARSIFKFKYKGSLKNIDSSYKNISSVLLRGNIKSNIQYTKISSKTRNGSFGIKGWVSSL